MTPENPSAFPSLEIKKTATGHISVENGMTLRDWFAGRAMQILISIDQCYK